MHLKYSTTLQIYYIQLFIGLRFKEYYILIDSVQFKIVTSIVQLVYSYIYWGRWKENAIQRHPRLVSCV